MINYKLELSKQEQELERTYNQYIRLYDKLSYQQNKKMLEDIILLQTNIRTLKRIINKKVGVNND